MMLIYKIKRYHKQSIRYRMLPTQDPQFLLVPFQISVEKVEFEKAPEETVPENGEDGGRKKSNEGGILNRAQQLQKERVEVTPPPRNPMD